MDGDSGRLDDLAAELDEAERTMKIAVATYEAKGTEYEQAYRQKYFPRPRHLRVVRDSVAVALLMAGAGWLFGALGRYRVALAAGLASAGVVGALIFSQTPEPGDEISSDPPGRTPGVLDPPTQRPTLGPSATPPSPGPSVAPSPIPLQTGGAGAPPSQIPEPSGIPISVPSLPPTGSPTASPTSPRTPSPTATRTPRPTTTPTAPPPPSPTPTPMPTNGTEDECLIEVEVEDVLELCLNPPGLGTQSGFLVAISLIARENTPVFSL